MKGLKLIGLAGLALCFILGAASAQAEEVTVNSLVDQMVKARNTSNWGEVTTISDQILARGDASKATRAQAKLYRVDAINGLKNSPEKIVAEFAKLETDSDFVDLWPVHLRISEAQQLGAFSGYEDKAVKAADDGIVIVRKMMETSIQKPDVGLWDRTFLLVGAKAVALNRLDRQDEAAEAVYDFLKEADQSGLAYGAYHMPGLLNVTQYFCSPGMKQPDKYLESGLFALGFVGRTRKAVEVDALIKRFITVGFDQAASSASSEIKAKVKAALLDVAKIDFKDKDVAAPVIAAAGELAGKIK